MTASDKTVLTLHIGHPKAGSSTLQAFLKKNWAALLDAGYTMPAENFTLATAESGPANVLWPLEEIKQKSDITPLRNWLFHPENTGKKLLISSENLANKAWPQLFAPFKDQLDIRLVYYLRRQDQLFLSAWRQWGLKRGLSLADLITRRIKKKQPDYKAILDGWLNTGMVSTHHVRFINPVFLSGGDLQQDFATFLGLIPGDCSPATDQNVSVDARLLWFLSKYPDLFDSPHDDEIIQLLRDVSKQRPDIRACLTEEQLKAISAAFEADNQALLKRYQPERAGVPVIEQTSAYLWETPDAVSEPAQRAYVRERLEAVQDISHPKLVRMAAHLE